MAHESGHTPPVVNVVRRRMEHCKREGLGPQLGKSEAWAEKVFNNQSGVMLDDLPAFLAALGLKVVALDKVCFPPDLARAYETIVRQAVADRSLIFEDSE